MFVVIVIHDVKPGHLHQARKRIDGNSARIADQPGLIFRHTGTSDTNQVVTLTGWRRLEDRSAWDATKRTLAVDVDPREIFDQVRSFTVEVYDERWRPELQRAAEGGR